MNNKTFLIIPLAVCTAACPAAIVPFTEDFDDGPANWYEGDESGPVDWLAAGGPDGGAYVTTTVFVEDPPPPFGITLFRAQDEFGSSGGAFEGDWLADGVTEFSFFVRHDGPGALDVFARFASPDNFPGAVGLSFVPVLPNVWTQIVIPIGLDSPNLLDEGVPLDQVFSNIGHVQIGAIPSEIFFGQTITVDLDKVSITPAPGGLVLLGLGGLGLRRRRAR